MDWDVLYENEAYDVAMKFIPISLKAWLLFMMAQTVWRCKIAVITYRGEVSHASHRWHNPRRVRVPSTENPSLCTFFASFVRLKYFAVSVIILDGTEKSQYM